MGNSPSTNQQTGNRSMSSVPFASAYARQLVDDEKRAFGLSTRAAVKSVARRLRRPSGTVWNLLFRAPKEISHDLFVALEEAVERRIVRQMEELQDELAAIRAGRRRVSPGVLAEAEASLARLRANLREGTVTEDERTEDGR